MCWLHASRAWHAWGALGERMAEQMSPVSTCRGLSQHPHPFLLTQSPHRAGSAQGSFSVVLSGFSGLLYICDAIYLSPGNSSKTGTGFVYFRICRHPQGLAESIVQGCLWAAELEAQLLVPKPLVCPGRKEPLSSRGRDNKAKLLPAPRSPGGWAWPGPSTSRPGGPGSFQLIGQLPSKPRPRVFNWEKIPMIGLATDPTWSAANPRCRPLSLGTRH